MVLSPTSFFDDGATFSCADHLRVFEVDAIEVRMGETRDTLY